MRALVILVFALAASQGYAQTKYNPILKKQLDSILIRDQQYRKSVHVNWKLQNKLDTENLEFVEKVIKQYGYPGKSLVGEETSVAAWFVIQHSPKIKEYFPIIEEAGRKGELRATAVCTMQDRLLTEQEKPQLYGSQVIGGYIYPVKDPATINKRRKEIGFPETIEEYARQMGAVYDSTMDMKKFEERTAIIIDETEGLSLEIIEKAKRSNKIDVPDAELPNSMFQYYWLADSCSQKKDYIAACNYLLQVNPYYLNYLGCADTNAFIFLNKFSLTATAKNAIAQKAAEQYITKPSPAYDTFRNYYTRIIKLRRKLDTIPYRMKAAVEKAINKLDSVQSQYLYNYVIKKGWPSVQDGSLYASYLAARDMEHCHDYLPLAMKAFSEGLVPLSVVKRIKGNTRAYHNYTVVKKYLRGHHMSVEGMQLITSSIKGTDVEKQLKDYIKKHCPMRDVFFVYYYNGYQKPHSFPEWDQEVVKREGSFYYLMDKIRESCYEFSNYGVGGLTLHIYYVPNNITVKERVLFYVID